MKQITLLCMLGIMAMVLPAQAQKYKLSKGHSIKFDGGGDVAGNFKDVSGTIVFNESDLSKSSVKLTIKTESINTGNAMMNNHARGKEWFDAKSFPTITFTSSSFKKTDKGYEVTGTLEMKGVKKEITIPFTFTPKAKGGEFKSKFQVNRNDFGIGKKEGTVSATIKLDITLPVTKG